MKKPEPPTIKELEDILDGKDRHIVLNPDGSISTGEIKEESQEHSKSSEALGYVADLHETHTYTWYCPKCNVPHTNEKPHSKGTQWNCWNCEVIVTIGEIKRAT